MVARARPELPAADKDGRIPYVVTFPIAGFEPGRYSVRALVMDGDKVAESETALHDRSLMTDVNHRDTETQRTHGALLWR